MVIRAQVDQKLRHSPLSHSMLSYYLYPLGWTIVNATGDATRGFSAHPGDAVEIAFPGADQTHAARIQITASCDTWHQELADLEQRYKRTALKSAFFDRLESQRERIYTARRNGGAGDHFYGVVAVRARAGPSHRRPLVAPVRRPAAPRADSQSYSSKRRASPLRSPAPRREPRPSVVSPPIQRHTEKARTATVQRMPAHPDPNQNNPNFDPIDAYLERTRDAALGHKKQWMKKHGVEVPMAMSLMDLYKLQHDHDNPPETKERASRKTLQPVQPIHLGGFGVEAIVNSPAFAETGLQYDVVSPRGVTCPYCNAKFWRGEWL